MGEAATVEDVDPAIAKQFSLTPGQLAALKEATFDGEPIWRQGEAPDAAEIEARKAAYFAPYHAALAQEIKNAEEDVADAKDETAKHKAQDTLDRLKQIEGALKE